MGILILQTVFSVNAMASEWGAISIYPVSDTTNRRANCRRWGSGQTVFHDSGNCGGTYLATIEEEKERSVMRGL